MEVFIGRQPIFNIHEQVVAYELLYRSREKTAFPLIDSDAATIDVLVNSFVSIGIDELTKGKPCFVNFTENLLYSEIIDYLDPSLVVIEVLENVTINDRLVDLLSDLKMRGFKIALDDFVLADDVGVYDELFKYIDYIKVDFLFSAVTERMAVENKVKSNFPHIQLLAEKVETREQYESAKQTGYAMFQGYFFEQPQMITETDIPANLLQHFQVISLLKDDEPNINQLAENIERDISMAYKLLQLINSKSRRSLFKIRSIKQAVLMLGLSELKKWVYLLAMREVNKNPDSDVFNELMRASLFRAKVCEKVARINYNDNFSEFFLVGLFSLIDCLLKRPLTSILAKMPFSEEIMETLSGVETEMSVVLRFSIALNKLNWQELEHLAPVVNLSPSEMIAIYDEVNNWVIETYNM